MPLALLSAYMLTMLQRIQKQPLSQMQKVRIPQSAIVHCCRSAVPIVHCRRSAVPARAP